MVVTIRQVVGAWLIATGFGWSLQLQAEVVSLDLSNGFNHDGYISVAEAEHAALYDPPENWGFINREVGRVFGDHFLSLWWLSYAWDDQGYSGLPADGVINTDYGLFQLSTQRDAEPAGGYEYLLPSEFTPLPTAPNVVRAYRPHSPDQNHPTASVNIDLPVAQQVRYNSVNFLVSGSEHKVFIYANYDDGAGGIDQQLLFEAPGAPKTTEETGFPEAKTDVSKNAAIIPALSMDHMWVKVNNRSQIQPYPSTIWTFANPLSVDSTKTLRGFTFAIYNEDSWRARRAFMYAASAKMVLWQSMVWTTMATMPSNEHPMMHTRLPGHKMNLETASATALNTATHRI